MSTGPSTLDIALALLDDLTQRATELRKKLRDGIASDGKPLDHASTLAAFGAATAAVANLSPENLASLDRAVRQGKLPRKKRA